ncbi:hypothetical protein SAMN06265171_101585 [Chryseobacterium rhizoplanae]|uniref:Uncharacterized protein n=1 Tax=Chryseobacterium rhizoplanae TaxID=1609531 RepID=A0A521AZX4_9FLAO|nr:hypothetical protein [Chryseobacterium rhizoplanae]SMO40373.1 hypothetical protein SAMN06265171_101585 [Chryseobacterium rhizoplanae]
MSKVKTPMMQVLSEIKKMPFTEQNRKTLIERVVNVYLITEKEVIEKAYSDALISKNTSQYEAPDLASSYYENNYSEIE